MPLDPEKFSILLEKLRAEAIGTISSAEDAAQTVELDQNRVGRLSRMDAMQGQAMAKANAERQQLLLTKIDNALNRIECRITAAVWNVMTGLPKGGWKLIQPPNFASMRL